MEQPGSGEQGWRGLGPWDPPSPPFSWAHRSTQGQQEWGLGSEGLGQGRGELGLPGPVHPSPSVLPTGSKGAQNQL